MQLPNAVRVGAWLLIGLNLLMAFGTIAIFTRMTPAIERIIERNERSLAAGEEMLTTLILARANHLPTEQRTGLRDRFLAALDTARGNITEGGEPEALDGITSHYEAAFAGEPVAIRSTVDSVSDLTRINRLAMRQADEAAQRLGIAGAWGVVFMALAMLAVTLIFLRAIRRRVIDPLVEIHEVLITARGESRFRRCGGGTAPSHEVDAVYREINRLLDDGLAQSRPE